MNEAVLEVRKVKDTLIFHQTKRGAWFVVLPNETFAIDVPALSSLLNYCIRHKFLSKKVLEGILSELQE